MSWNTSGKKPQSGVVEIRPSTLLSASIRPSPAPAGLPGPGFTRQEEKLKIAL